MNTVVYLVKYFNHDNEYKETEIAVPAYLPYYDHNDQEDVPLYIKANIEDIEMLEHYEEAALN